MSDTGDERESLELAAEADKAVFIGGTRATVGLVRKIFDEIASKSETVSEYFDKPYQIKSDDLNQLHHKIGQTLKQYSIASLTNTFTIYYCNNTKDEFNSFDSFATYNAGSASPIENIVVVYKFLNITPNDRKAESYEISLRIVSALGLRTRMENDDLGPPVPNIFRFMGNRTGLLKISYQDYTIARSLSGVVREWFSTLELAPENKLMSFLQKHSYFLPRLLRYIATLAVASILLVNVSRGTMLLQNGLIEYSQFILIIFITLYSTYVLTSWTGEFIENAIDSWVPLSYVKFNQGDALQITTFKRKNKNSVIKAISGFICSIIMSILTKFSASLLIEFFTNKH